VDQPQPLRGYTVAVTAGYPGDATGALLERAGARVVRAAVGRFVPPAQDEDLRTATTALIERPPRLLVDQAGTGLRGWLAAAAGWGLATRLRAALAGARRYPAGTGAAELARRAAGHRVALHLLAGGYPDLSAALAAAGADVVEVRVHRWVPPPDATALRRVVDLATARLLDALVVGSAPAAGALLLAAGTDRLVLLDVLRTGVVVAAPDRAAAAALAGHGVPMLTPARGHGAAAVPGALTDLLAAAVPQRAATVTVAGRRVTLRGHVAVVDGALRPLAAAPMAVLRALAAVPGRVLSRAVLRAALPRTGDEHAVEMAVARLRVGLGTAGLVQTVARRGYRLRVE